MNRTKAGVGQGSTDLTGPTHKTDQGRAGRMPFRNTENVPYCNHYPETESGAMVQVPMPSRRDGAVLVLCVRCARRVAKALA